MGSLWNCHYCWPPSVPCWSPQVPPTPVGMEDRTGLRDDSHCCSVQWAWITLGKHRGLQVGERYGSHILRKEVPCGDYTYGLAKGSTTYGSLWGRLPGVRSIHSRDGRRSLRGKGTGSPWGESYRGRIHMWDHPKGNHYTRAPSPAQGLTLGKHMSAGPGVWHTLEQGSLRGTELKSHKSTRIRSVEGNDAARVVTVWDFHSIIIVSWKYHGFIVPWYMVLNNQNFFSLVKQMFGSMCFFKFH